MYIDDVEDERIRPGFHVGVFGQSELSDAVGLQSELLFTTAGNRTTYNQGGLDQEVDFNLNYIQLPLMITFKIADVLDIHGGPYAAYLVNANVSTDGNLGAGSEDLDRDNFDDFDFGLAAGVGVNINALQVGVRYNLGLTEIADSPESRTLLGDAKNVVGQIYFAIGL